jgi:hypothetical protein
MGKRRSFQFSASACFALSPFIQDHDHCWKSGAVEQLRGERTMRTGHSGMSPSIITAGRIDINVTAKPSTHPSYSDIVVRFP